MEPVNHVRQWVVRGVAAVVTALILGGATLSLAQESVAVRASMVQGPLPVDDPNAAVWTSATPATFPMSPQVHWPDRILATTV